MEQQTEIFVPKSLAMELQAKGFDWHCVAFYSNRHDEVRFKSYGVLMEEQLYGAPTYDQVVGWFASKHSKDIIPILSPTLQEYSVVIYGKHSGVLHKTEWFANRQQSLLTAFEEALKLI
jgi:hypothetical protein